MNESPAQACPPATGLGLADMQVRAPRRRSRLDCAAGVLAGLLLLAAGCGTPRGTAPPVGAYADLHPRIIPNTHGTMPDAFYEPSPIRVRVGQTITWINKDNDLHDVTEVDGLFGSYPLTLNGTFAWTPTRPGTYPYFCTLHPEMHGMIIVSREP